MLDILRRTVGAGPHFFRLISDNLRSITKYLPANFLYHVNAVELLVVPESVSEVSPNAFAGSSLSEIYFNGACPKGFCRKGLSADIFVRRKTYKSFFS